MAWGTVAQLAGPILSGIGSGLASSDPDEEARLRYLNYKRKRTKDLEPGILKGITSANLAQIAQLFRKSAMPMINRFVGGAASKFGSRSGKVAGAMGAASGQYLGAPMANYAGQAQQLNLQMKKYLHSAYST